MLAGGADQPEVEGEVVDGANLEAEDFLGADEVVEVGEGVDVVAVGVAFGVDGVEAGFPLFVFNVDGAVGSEEKSVAAVAGGHYAVEHVNAAFDGFENVGRSADAHEVAWAVEGKDGVDNFNHLVHGFGGFAHGEAADGVAFGVFGGYVFGRLTAEVGIFAALDDGEEALVVAVEGLGGVEAVDAAVEPAVGELHGVFGVAVVGLAGSALVEGHDDVGSDDTLNVHYPFGGEEVAAAVDVGAEGAALVGDFAVFGKRENLKAAAVGEQRAFPTVEAVEATGSAEDVETGTQVEMVGVAEYDLGVDVVA